MNRRAYTLGMLALVSASLFNCTKAADSAAMREDGGPATSNCNDVRATNCEGGSLPADGSDSTTVASDAGNDSGDAGIPEVRDRIAAGDSFACGIRSDG